MEQFIVGGMSCAACQARVEKAVAKVPGVKSVAVSLLTNSMGVEGSAAQADIIKAVENAGYTASPKGGRKTGKPVEGAIGAGNGGTPASGNDVSGIRNDTSTDGNGVSDSGKGISATGNGVSISGDGAFAADDESFSSPEGTFAEEEEMLRDRETPKLKRRLVFSAFFLLMIMYIGMGYNMLGLPLPSFFEHNYLGLTLSQMFLAAIVMFINRKFFTSGFRSLFHGAPNMDTLVALGSTASFGWSVVVFYQMCGLVTRGAPNMDLMELYHKQLYFESAAMIPALITVGKMLEAMSKGRTTDALKSLMRLAPETAVLLRDGEEKEVPIGEVRPGDIFIIRPGDNIPVDGIVLEGSSAVNEAALTGESIPVDKAEGDHVSAATMNSSGYLRCRATRVGQDTTLAQIIHMVSDAAATKAPIAKIADTVSGIFVPAVIAIALAVTFGWLRAGESLGFALARGISVLVISCPCALGLATPVAIMVGNGLGARNGILFKTSEALENAGRTKIVALDKTGTITRGVPEVTDICPAPGHTEDEILEKASALEQKSEHPLARAITKEADDRKLPDSEVSGFSALPGNGLTAVLDGHTLHGGSGKYIRSLVPIPEELDSVSEKLAAQGKTPLFFEEDGKLLGIIAVADAVKPDSEKAIRELKDLGLRIVMLTGDNERTAKAIGQAAGVDEVVAGVLPDGKEAAIRDLQKKGKVAMVGDGINDAPALTRADTGIAIGAGTDVAIDSADVVLMNSSLMDVPAAIRLSRATLRNIHENLFWAFFYNLICIPLAAGLFAWKMNPMIGAAAMSLSSFTVCMNALRLNLFDIRATSKTPDLTEGIEALSTDDEIKDTGTVNAKTENETMETGNAEAGNEAMESGNAEAGNETLKTENERSKSMTATVKIEGMMCAHCEATVKKALEALPFVQSAEVSHQDGKAVLALSGSLDEQAVKTAIEDRDYAFLGIETA